MTREILYIVTFGSLSEKIPEPGHLYLCRSLPIQVINTKRLLGLM